jgi:hypothetical protein
LLAVDDGWHPTRGRPIGREKLDHALFGERMLSDVDEQLAKAGSAPLVAKAIGEANRAHMVGAV